MLTTLCNIFCIFATMKIFTGKQIKELDTYTIEHEPIRPIDLMERASKAITRAISEIWADTMPIVVFAGPGNNGGDALAVARMLAEQNYNVSVYLFNINDNLSEECSINKKRVLDCKRIKNFTEVTQQFDPPVLDSKTLVVDGLFGTGLHKPLSGGFASLVKYINQSAAKIVAIDVPSGLMTEDNTYNIPQNIIRANITLSLQMKKMSFMFADTQQYIGKLKLLDIRLSQEYIDKTETRIHITEENDVRNMLIGRHDFDHKGTIGNALLISGSYGMAGASVLAARACLRSGVGRLTVHTPRKNYTVMQTAVPEAVMQMDREETIFSEAVDAEDYDALGIGPGLGQSENTAIALIAQLRRTSAPIIADADALNILANHRAWMQQLPKDIIMTPHPKEFERLYGNRCNGDYERLSKAREMAERLQAYIILKGHYSALCQPDGHIFFNSTGNSGMATAGSGDVLTGIITALLSRGYTHHEACVMGMYLHGLAGDIAAKEYGKESLIASDIIDFLPKAFKRLEE